MEIMMTGSPEDICLFACSPQSPGDTWQLRSCLAQEGGCWSPRDTWRLRCCAEPRGHVTTSELPRARSGSPSRGDTWRPRSCPQPEGGSCCLDLKLVRGGTRSSGYRQWPRAHPGRGCEPVGGANILFPRNLSESSCVGISKRWCSTTNTWRPTIRADVAMLAEPSCTAVPRGSLLLNGNRGA
jgi:hypothetical protein